MVDSHHHIIDPTTIQSIKDFEWIAKTLANGFMHGKHQSSRLGTGHEFQQYRPYVPGDDIRSIDWKMYAKTDKFYIKQTDIETEHNYLFLLDNSGSMKYQEAGWSKFMLGKLITAAMMRIVANQGDLFSWSSNNVNVSTGSGLRHWQYCIEELYHLDIHTSLQPLASESRAGVTIVWISDFYGKVDEIYTQLRRLKNHKSELILFHLMGEDEKTLNFGRNSTFIDLESNERLNVNSSASKDTYLKKLSAHLASIKHLCFEAGAIYQEVSMNKPITVALRQFFHHYKYSSI